MDNFDNEQYPSRLEITGIVEPWGDPSLLLRKATPPPERPARRKQKFVRPDPDGYKAARAAAGGADTFVAQCYAHGVTMFDTACGGCLTCEASVSRSNLPAVRVAELTGADHYMAECAEHGRVPHHTGSERCATCSAGKVGRPGNPARIAARRLGLTSYLATCGVHGEVPHHTVRGKCLRCFNSLGYPRKAAAP